MTNNRTKGTRKEHECLEQFKAWMQENKPGHKLIAQWRSISNAYNNTDYLGSWDLALCYNYEKIQVEYRIQVKSAFNLKYYRSLQAKWENSLAYNWLAIYGKVPKVILSQQGRLPKAMQIQLKGFTLIRI
jgi:hypothetical protein